MSTIPLRILIVDDEPAHVEAIRRALLGAQPELDIQSADSLRNYQRAVVASPPDLALIDYVLPDGRADSALISPPETGSFPIVVMTGEGNEQVAVAVLKRGALDYIVKSREAFDQMPHAVNRTLRTWRELKARQQAQEALRASEERFRLAVEAAQIGTWDRNVRTGQLYWSPEMEQMMGYEPGTFPGTDEAFRELLHPDCLAIHAEAQRCARSEGGRFRAELHFRLRDGRERWGLESGKTTFDAEGHPERIVGVDIDITERKQAEEAALREHVLLRTLIDLLPDNIYVKDTAGRFLVSNLANAKALGKNVPDEVIGLSDADFFPPPVAAAFRAQEQKVIAGEALHNHEEETDFPNGHRNVGLSSKVPWFDAQGRICGLVGIGREITERKRVEEALRRSQSALLEAQRLARVGNWESDGPSGKVIWSDELYRIYGRDPALGPADLPEMAQYFTPESWARLSVAKERTLAHGTPYECDAEVVRTDGTRAWVTSRGETIRNDKGEIIGLRGTTQDITERKQAENALRQSEEQFRAMFELASIGMAQADPRTGHFVRVNQKMCAITGYSEAEMFQIRVPEITHPEDRAKDWEAFQAVVRGEAPDYRMEKRYVRKDGKIAWVNVNMTVIRDADGQPTRTIATIEDVSDRKRLEEQLREAQKLDAIGQLAGGVAHDFNNILAAILMQLGLLQMNPISDPETSQALRDVEAEARRAASLTRQLLMFSRRSVLEVKPLDLNNIVGDLLKMLRRLIGEHIKLMFDGYTGPLPSVEADAGMLEQVLMNLVVNARDAMPKGGQVTIRTNVETFGEDASRQNVNRQPGRFVCLAVSDTGIGMNKETLERIFEPFFTTKEPGKGTGLGLATAHGIVAQHKGWVEVESELGKGTTFRVFLPALAEGVARATDETPRGPLQRGRETILVVEDETKVRQTVSQTMRVLGYRVYEAANGQEAITLWQQHGAEVDLLFTDMVMPEGMTGLELAERLQAIKPALRVVISSGYSSEIFQAGGIKQAGVWYLPKPYETETLAETIRACLDRKS
jgi:two-component system, cell cycle sensor histidine kinase and response regulator CckA